MDLRLKHVLLPERHSGSHLAKVPCLWQAWDPRGGGVEGTTGQIPSAGLL